MPKQLRFLSVCSGIEAASVAWEQLGWKAVGFSEIEPFPCEVLKQRFPNVPNYGDLNGHEQWPLAAGDVDIIAGGPPCQAFSVAGLREGMADPRGNLSLVYFQLVSRLRPKWIVYENVPGLLSARGGQDFSSLLSALAECGYGFAYRILDAANFGLAQRRKRIFIVGCRTGDWRHPTAVLFDGPSSFGNPKAGKKAGEGIASPAGTGVGGPSKRKWPADITCTLNASFGSKLGLEDQHALGGASLFVSSPICMSSGQANAAISHNLAHILNATHETQTVALPVIADRASFNQGEAASSPNSNPTEMVKGTEPFAERDLIGTLCARDFKGVGNQFVQEGKCIPVSLPIAFKVRGGGEYTGTKGGEVRPNERGGTGMLHYEDKTFTVAATQDQFVATQLLYENHAQDSRVTGPHDIAPTVAAKFGTGGGNVPLVQGADPVTFQPGNLRLDAGADPSTEATTTLKASMGDQMPHIATPMAVRRLLPSECEKLQGFPRDWTKIPWRGKPADLCPDGPRYKAIGNSMATNCMAWIGKRIQMVDEVIG